MAQVLMPRLSDSMEEGTIVRWLRADGDDVRRGEELVEIETDKATMTHEADEDGPLAIVAGEGETLPIGAVIATIGGGAGPVPDGADAAPARVAYARVASARVSPAPEERVRASPLARRLARDHGLELSGLTGSGPGGRVVRADVEQAAGAEAPAAPAGPAAPEPASPGAKGETTLVAASRAQRLIARRMAEAKATVPEFTLTAVVDMEGCVDARAGLAAGPGEGDVVPSVNDMVIKACALALRDVPRANASYRDGDFALHGRVNVGYAVATEGALVVPTIFDADTKSLARIATETRELTARVRAGEITPPELAGGTFTVSNLGMYGVARFTAVINPPQAAILAVGAVEPRVVAVGGAPVVRRRMDVTLTCDHRILYGAEAAGFLGHIRARLEQPLALAR